MTNGEKSEKLIKEAEKIIEDMDRAFLSKSWNLAIRRAQEIVELVLKSILFEMCIDYPKVHDVASIFLNAVKKKKIDVDGKFSEWLKKFSADLATKRAPAFYFEDEYTEKDARSSLEGAKKVFNFGKNFLQKI